jgi:hypothetical protein
MTSRRIVLATAVVAASSLYGCGGGGDNAAALGAARITEANAVTVTAAAFDVADALYSTSADSASLLTGVLTQTPTGQFSIVDFTAKKLLASAGLAIPAVPSVTGVVLSETFLCTGGGSLTVTFNDADNDDELSTGDSGTFAFANCVEDGVSVNGAFSIYGLVVSGTSTSPAQTVGATVAFSNFQFNDGVDIGSVNGDLSLQVAATRSATTNYSITIAGSQLAMTLNGANRVLSNYAANLAINGATSGYQYGLSATLAGAGLPGSITMNTPSPFVGILGGYPASGTMVIGGAGNSSLRLIANSATSVTIQTDANGDGNYEASTTMTWAQLDAT